MTSTTDQTEPHDIRVEGRRPSDSFAATRWNRGIRSTVPLVIAGAMTVGLTLTGAVDPVSAAPKKPGKTKGELRASLDATPTRDPAAPAAGLVPASVVPVSHVVTAGDTVSSIAGQYGLSTASVLAVNGLGWKSLIFPGQVLKLGSGAAASPTPTPTPAPATAPAPSASGYTISSGDTIGGIAARFGVSVQSVLEANGLGWSSIIYPGQTLSIPGTMTLASAVDPAPAPSAPPAASAPSTEYTIQSGDTPSSIAAAHGVGVDSLLAENGLTGSGVIFAGRTLRIPALVAPVQDGTTVTPLSAEMAGNAQTVIRVGRSLGVSERGIVIALAAAMQESSLRNIDYGDRDSLGLFQQRPSTGWGTPSQLLDPTHSARLFYGGPGNPNSGVTDGLLDITGWEGMSVTQAAQAVQISAFPDAYAKWEKSAWAWLAQLS